MILYILNILLYILIIFLLLFFCIKKNKGYYYKGWYIIHLIIFILFGTFAFYTGDYMHYKQEVERVSLSLLTETHFEYVYVLLANILNGNYTLWRFCIYLIMFVLLNHFLKITNNRSYYSLFWYSLFILPSDLNGRSSIGVLSYFIAIIYFFKKQYFYGIIFVIVAMVSHKSIIPLILLLPLCNKDMSLNSFKLYFILIPLFSVFLNVFFIDILIKYDIIREESFLNYKDNYSSGGINSIGGFLFLVIRTLPSYIITVLFTLKLITKKIWEDDLMYKIKNFSMFFVLVLSVLAFSFGLNNPMFYRYFFMLNYLYFLLLPYLYPELYKLKLTKKNAFIVFFFMASSIFSCTLFAYYQYCG